MTGIWCNVYLIVDEKRHNGEPNNCLFCLHFIMIKRVRKTTVFSGLFSKNNMAITAVCNCIFAICFFL